MYLQDRLSRVKGELAARATTFDPVDEHAAAYWQGVGANFGVYLTQLEEIEGQLRHLDDKQIRRCHNALDIAQTSLERLEGVHDLHYVNDLASCARGLAERLRERVSI